ncbi:hypothetical protein ACFC1R_32360 [Kitasatospora sp. NPDC056138]|uniref:hypothetical protein n=1 Tax=Kitasatospora sp. NPDC056138 TaxID=3345724 RepID=UPI0035E0774C
MNERPCLALRFAAIILAISATGGVVREVRWLEAAELDDLCVPNEARRIRAALARLADSSAPVYHVEGYAFAA